MKCLSHIALAILLIGAARTADIPMAHEVSEPLFRNHVQSILTKSGCNMGACHGAGAGKNGFYLSLRGYDDEADYRAITRHGGGRRIQPADPARSLLLTKPTGAVPHKGGKRFETNSPEYKVLADWIAQGAPGPRDDDPKMVRLEVLPERTTLTLGATQALTVRAHFSNGRVEDVTRWAKWNAANAQVANVDDQGVVQVQGSGEGAISAWYLSQLAVAFITSPFTNQVNASTWAALPARNFIDREINRRLTELNLPPSPRSDDGTFLRRAHLDTIGVLPTVAEWKAFISDASPDKRDRLIEALLNRPEFTDYWSYKWSDLLLVNSAKLPAPTARSYYRWIRHRVEANLPWDRLVKELITARGTTGENGAVAFYLLHDDPRTMAENTTQAFMGMSIGCAKCHNHPMEKWTNDDYFAFANLFSRVRTKNGSGTDKSVIVTDQGDLIQPRTGKPQPPRPLEGKTLDPNLPQDRREALADWLVSPGNSFFAKSIVNRVWANFFGLGLVDKVDDLRVSNPASNEALLAAAAGFLVEQKYDLKSLMREILRSEAYQRSSESLPENRTDTRYFSHFQPRRLMAEVLLDAVSQVTGSPTDFVSDAGQGQKSDLFFPKGYRALQLPDSFVKSYFLKSFGRPERQQTCECERTSEPSVAQVLHLSNGDTVNTKLKAGGNVIESRCHSQTNPSDIIEEAFVAALARRPSPKEIQRIRPALESSNSTERRAAVEDLYWALLSTKEFLFNH